ncbi:MULTISPECIES: hypothetical protein [Caloramator]|jgi:hypothetical protein|uniref:Uncharacterized protein n=1 Tax=Caloramator australicus RC3 TaxID=857293 RepID=I7KV76_9CLOT|nr:MULTISPECIES: hypothetical protein [Caloramator]MDO6355186.1 hypothetical protein [Caloramator sp. CAR-1]WDU82336.1 hypothetical protein PWK10_11655 [Caloramator sp. Dgby_cultured_2]CCJ33889.1 hypothetical protein CAAU_1805 [Caloramator australicus RC3]
MSKKCGCYKGSDFYNLLALLLIILQFGKRPDHSGSHHDGGDLLDNSLLFVISLFLIVCGCCGFKRGCTAD